jgi:hypothetical protein
MGKSTLVTRGGCEYTLAAGEHRSGQEYFGCPAAVRTRTPRGRAGCQRAKPFWSRIALSVGTRGALFCPFWCVTFPEHTRSFFASAEGAAGVV